MVITKVQIVSNKTIEITVVKENRKVFYVFEIPFEELNSSLSEEAKSLIEEEKVMEVADHD